MFLSDARQPEGRPFFLLIQSTLSKTDTFGTGTKCPSPSYRESNKGRKEGQGPTLSVRFTEVSVKREYALTLPNSYC